VREYLPGCVSTPGRPDVKFRLIENLDNNVQVDRFVIDRQYAPV
jgi:hypothetical protein